MATPTTSTRLLARLDARDRALFLRWSHHAKASHLRSHWWKVLTHLGGARVTIALALVLIFLPNGGASAASHCSAVLAWSHLFVQLIKRYCSRPRPCVTLSLNSFINTPDRFSFPSGHSCAAMAIAISYAAVFPALAVPLLLLALIVGVSRVVVGLHYPGDVVVGQALALIVAGVVFA